MDWNQIEAFAQFSFVALSSIFFIVDPFATVPPFLALTGGYKEENRRQIEKQAAWTCFGRVCVGGQPDLQSLWDHVASLQDRRRTVVAAGGLRDVGSKALRYARK